MSESLATVRQITRNHVEIKPRFDCHCTVFNIRSGEEVEAVVSTDDGTETVRLLIAAPEENQTMSIKIDGFITNIIYQEKPGV